MQKSPEIIGAESPLTWLEFEVEIHNLREELKAQKQQSHEYRIFGDWLFRGQRDARWGLKTSLERYLEKSGQTSIGNISIGEYFAKMTSVVPAINSLAEKNFDRDVVPEDDTIIPWNLKSLEIAYYLRHHGFPTPTLDWSRSYLVASFFAFQEANPDTPVAVYAYNESLEEVRGGYVGEPIIQTLGPYVQTHRRHFLQQSEYTYCTAKQDGELYFQSHDDAMNSNPRNHPCKKFILAGTERQKVLEKLDEANINAYTLYGNEEGLMEMLAFRALRF